MEKMQEYAIELYIQIVNSSNLGKRILNREDPIIQLLYNQEMIMLNILRGISEPTFEKALEERDKPSESE